MGFASVMVSLWWQDYYFMEIDCKNFRSNGVDGSLAFGIVVWTSVFGTPWLEFSELVTTDQ